MQRISWVEFGGGINAKGFNAVAARRFEEIFEKSVEILCFQAYIAIGIGLNPINEKIKKNMEPGFTNYRNLVLIHKEPRSKSPDFVYYSEKKLK